MRCNKALIRKCQSVFDGSEASVDQFVVDIATVNIVNVVIVGSIKAIVVGKIFVFDNFKLLANNPRDFLVKQGALKSIVSTTT